MPVSVTYPGVYVEEIPSGVRTIANVATSITAFAGKALRGPVSSPETITSFADFERLFGGMDRDITLGYAVRDFFLNGGSIAIIVRVYKVTDAAKSKALFDFTDLKLSAANEGTWGARVRARVDKKVETDANVKAAAASLGVAPAEIFDLTVRDALTGRMETFLNLTMKDSARRVDRVLESESSLVRVTARAADKMPKFSAGALTDADVWTDNTKSTAGADGQDSAALTSTELKAAVNLLDKVDLFNLLCILPDARGGDVPDDVYQEAMSLCARRRAFLLVDAKAGWNSVSAVQSGVADMNLNGEAARNAAVYFPRIRQADPMLNGQIDTFPASGMIAGVIARTDSQRGVWKAPAGTDAALIGVAALSANLTDAENGLLNPLGINCVRNFPIFGNVVWGARTLRGADAAADEYKYIPVRRTALFIEESLYRGLKWVVFQPNDDPLWSQIRLNVGAFIHNLFRQGAFQGKTPREAYLVKCDAETTTQNDINLGIVNIVVGFAPLKPAEFVIIKLQQLAGQIQA
jgi:phage tail sheath protein FI